MKHHEAFESDQVIATFYTRINPCITCTLEFMVRIGHTRFAPYYGAFDILVCHISTTATYMPKGGWGGGGAVEQ